MNKSARNATIRAIAKLTHIDLVSAIKSKRMSPILDSEIHIEEELINLKESLDSYYTAGETLRQYPRMYSHISREKRAILKHCIGLVVRMMHGRALPRPYSKQDVDYAVRRLVQLIVLEAQKAGRRIDDDVLAVLRPYLSVRQRLALRDFGMDLLMQVSQLQRAQSLLGRLPALRSR